MTASEPENCQKKHTAILLGLMKNVCSMNIPEKYEKLATVMEHHSTVESALVLHRLYA